MCGGYVHSRPFGRASVTHGCCQARSLYEAGGAYELFAGRECGRALSQMCGCPGRRPARSPTLNATVGRCQVVRGRGLGRSCPRSTALSPQPPQRVDRFLRNEGLRTALPMQLPLTDWQLKAAALLRSTTSSAISAIGARRWMVAAARPEARCCLLPRQERRDDELLTGLRWTYSLTFVLTRRRRMSAAAAPSERHEPKVAHGTAASHRRPTSTMGRNDEILPTTRHPAALHAACSSRELLEPSAATS